MKKSLGQNFLRDPKILEKIVNSAQIKTSDTVLEIGPGEGTLTALLLDKAAKVLAVEKDEELSAYLKEKFKDEIENRKLEIIIGDVLEKYLIERALGGVATTDRGNFQQEISVPSETNIYPKHPYVLVGNIPYYITGEIFKKFLESKNQPTSLTFVVQKEVAERILARNGKESVLSISIKAYGTPEYGGLIKAGSFTPVPQVDSAIISVRNINKEKFKGIKEKHFFEIVKKGFAHKRKFLSSNLAIPASTLVELNIPPKIRAEDLSLQNWFDLAKILI